MAKKATATKRKVETEVKLYELMLILDPNLRESEIKKKLKDTEDMVEKAGGKVVHQDFWGKRPMAYCLKGHREGVYVVYNLELPNSYIKELREHLRIEKELLRSMILSLPEGHVYTKYDLDKAKERAAPKRTENRRSSDRKNVSIKHSTPTVGAKAEEKKEEDKEKGKEVDEKALDEKLDKILEGDDLNL